MEDIREDTLDQLEGNRRGNSMDLGDFA
jgi:hypothetical protein